MVRLLISINDIMGRNALLAACASGDAGLVGSLLDRGIGCDFQSLFCCLGELPLELVCMFGKSRFDIAKLLCSHGVRGNYACQDEDEGNNVLNAVVRDSIGSADSGSYTELIGAIVAGGGDDNFRNHHGRSALHTAVKFRGVSTAVVALLLGSSRCDMNLPVDFQRGFNPDELEGATPCALPALWETWMPCGCCSPTGRLSMRFFLTLF